jgi:hypothetical protein
MRQLVELQCEKKETTRRRYKIKKPPYPMKLGEIWKRASRELKQIRIEFGDASRKEACAMGAISFYLSDKKTCLLSELEFAWQKAVFRDMVKTFESKTKSSIWELNDLQGWTFEQFAEKANELGL